MSDAKVTIEESSSYFGPLYPYICDDEITDIDYNGRTLWLTTCRNERYRCRQVEISNDFVEEFTKRVSNTVSKPFHKLSPILEAETDTLRITIVHESAAISGRTICIRKSMPFVRLTEEGMIAEKYASEEIISLLKACVVAKLNMVFCGEPGVGKTECAKFFSQFIPSNERVITIEDNPEWHYSAISPNSDSVELRINQTMDYTQAIKTSLRLNPKWMMLSEVRSKEVLYLIESFSTGVRGMTTLHTDDVRKVPDRMLNMAGQAGSEGRLENDIYSFIDVAVLIRRKAFEEDGRSVIRRYIDQVGFFFRKGDENLTCLAVDGGVLTDASIPEELRMSLAEAGCICKTPAQAKEGRYTELRSDISDEKNTEKSEPEFFTNESFEQAGAEDTKEEEERRERELAMKKYMEQIGATLITACNERGTYIGASNSF